VQFLKSLLLSELVIVKFSLSSISRFVSSSAPLSVSNASRYAHVLLGVSLILLVLVSLLANVYVSVAFIFVYPALPLLSAGVRYC
jgi:hypothetical protein